MTSGLGDERSAGSAATAQRRYRAAAVALVACYPYVCAAALFVTGWVVLSLPWLTGHVTIPYDAKAHFQAQIQFLANAINSGQSPFWNPNAFAGQPHVADPQSLIFSPAILLALLSSAPSFRLVDGYVLTLLACGGLAVIMLFREMRWPVAGAIVAAFAFSFGASAALRVQHVGQVQSLVFIMIAHWLLARLLHKARWRDGVFFGVAAALAVVEPNQVALLGAYLLALYVIWHVASQPNVRAQARKLALPLAVAGAVAIALSIIPLSMTYLFVESTTRAQVPFAEAAKGSLHPASLLTAFVADLFGAVDSSLDYWGPFSDAWGRNNHALTQNMGHLYIGALPAIAIICVGLVRGKAWDRGVRYYSVATALSLLYALGVHTPLFPLAFDVLPGVSGFRRPADATFLLGAYGAILAGYLVNQFLAQEQRVIARPFAPAGRKFDASLIAAAACVAIFASAAGVAWSVGKLDHAIIKIAAAASWCALALALVLAIRRSGAAARGMSFAALATLMVADLRANNGPNESTALPPAHYEVLRLDSVNPTLCEIKRLLSTVEAPERRDRIETVGVGFHWPNAGLVHGIENVLGYNPLRLQLYSLATGARDQVAGWDQRSFSPLFPSYRSLLADMLGLRLIVAGAPIEKIDKRLRPGDLRLVARTAEAYIYENPRAYARVMFATDWRLADFDDLIERGQWPAFDPKSTVLLDSEPNPMPGRQILKAASRVSLRSYANTRVEIDVDAAQPGFVVLNDIWHPWWTATVNGAPVEILRANVLFRAEQVDTGRHRVVFEFSPLTGAIAELRERLLDPGE